MSNIFDTSSRTKLLDKDRLRKICFYGRVSTDDEAQLSALQNQMQWYDDQLKYHPNWVLVERYIDEGITGTQAKKRPAFLRMIEDAKDGKFDLIVTREVCRFARNTVDTLIYTRELKNQYGVEVFFVEDNIWTMDGDGELRLTIMATLAQEESRKISDRVRAGQYISKKNGTIYGSGNILGYDRNGKSYVINPEQAETVRMIYQLYLSGLGEYKIVNEMVRLQRKTSSGNTNWNRNTISLILKNTTYKGVMTFGQTYCKSHLDQRRLRNYDLSTRSYESIDVPIIISPEDWDRVQEIRESKCVRYGSGKCHGKKPTKNVWLKKAVCSCGATFRRVKWRTNKKNGETVYAYQCYRQFNYGSKSFRENQGLDVEGYCDIHQVGEWKLDLMAKEIFYTIWKERCSHVLLAYEMIAENYQSNEDDNSQRMKLLEERLGKVKNKIENLISMRADGELTKEEYISMRKKFDDEKSKIESEIESINSENTETQPAFNLDAIKEALEMAIDFSQAKMPDYIIESFVEKVVPISNTMFRWYIDLNGGFGEKAQKEFVIGVDGRKNKPSIIEEDGSIHEPYCTDSESLFTQQESPTLLHESSELYRHKGWRIYHIEGSKYLSFMFVITMDIAEQFFAQIGRKLCMKWSDITVEVLLKV